MQKLTCHYCFEKFYPAEIMFRCINPNPGICVPETDLPLQNFRGLISPPVMPKIIPNKQQNKRLPKSAKCGCGTTSTKTICPHCHNELPHQFGMSETCTIALIGAKNVGKSHYLAVLINELKNRIGIRFKASLSALDDQTIRRYNHDFKRYLYDANETIPITLSARTKAEVRYPMVYRMHTEKQWFPWFSTQKIIDLVFFDTAGEDLADLDIMITENRYIANADGIIFLLDPLQIPAVRSQLPNGANLPQVNSSQDQIITRTANLIQQIRQEKLGKKIDIPVAMTFSKMDAMRALVDPILLRASNHNGYLDLNDVEIINDLFCTYLEMWLGRNALQFINQQYKTVSFFGVSALGAAPDEAGKLSKGIHPYRIEDPLLWILNQKGFIPGKRTKEAYNGV